MKIYEYPPPFKNEEVQVFGPDRPRGVWTLEAFTDEDTIKASYRRAGQERKAGILIDLDIEQFYLLRKNQYENR